jgi:hypothetical protein
MKQKRNRCFHNVKPEAPLLENGSGHPMLPNISSDQYYVEGNDLLRNISSNGIVTAYARLNKLKTFQATAAIWSAHGISAQHLAKDSWLDVHQARVLFLYQLSTTGELSGAQFGL